MILPMLQVSDEEQKWPWPMAMAMESVTMILSGMKLRSCREM